MLDKEEDEKVMDAAKNALAAIKEKIKQEETA